VTEFTDGGANSTAIYDADGNLIADDAGDGYTFTVVTDPTILSVDDQPQPDLVVENTFNFAQVSVTKTVVSLGIDINGDPIAYGPFEVELACTWHGEMVTAAEPMTQTIADGETVTWTELPEDANCTITETNTMDAPVTTVTVTQGGATGDTTEGTVAELDPLPNVDAEDQTSVALVNEYPDPPVLVSKVVEGDAPDPGRTYTFDVFCVLIDASHPAPGLLLRDTTIEVGTESAFVATLLPTGAECTITEVDTGGADDTTITIDGVPLSGTTAVAVLGTVTMEIVVTNTFALPTTGLDSALLWTVGAVAMALLAGGILLAGMRRRQDG
jgi:LPXTG-motif cell wall-anchored protein